MNYIFIALKAEADPLIRYFSLKEEKNLPNLRLFSGGNLRLIISAVGKERVLRSVDSVFSLYSPGLTDSFYNIGICGAPSDYSLNEIYLITSVQDNESGKVLELNVKTGSDLKTAELLTVNKPLTASNDRNITSLVDMEGVHIATALAERGFLDRLTLLKIVSDHLNPGAIKRDSVNRSISQKLDIIDKLLVK
ncbi:MAG: hypothetical protein D6719_01040 [Candidatus Dadabacteria bacterium]|nr:MAG: hypothetical protein D6719_01040 [Candidatus Dadabacteria bacterium]